MTASVVFIHGMWLHAGGWRPWQELFEKQGYTTRAPGWPGEADSVVATRANPDRVAGTSLEEITDSFQRVIEGLEEPPVLVGHSFGGLIAEKLRDRGLAAGTVCFSPAPIKGVRAVPFSQLRSSFPGLRNPANRRKAVALTPRQFAYAFGNAIPAEESAELFRSVSIPSSARPLFEVATANLRRHSSAAVDTTRTDLGPLLLVAAGKDHTVPAVVVRGAQKLYARGGATTELRTYDDRGHSGVLDHGWRELADDTLAWLDGHGLRP